MLLDAVLQGVLPAARPGESQPAPAAPGGLEGEPDGTGEVGQGVPVAGIELAELPGRVGKTRGGEVGSHRPAVLHQPIPLVAGEHTVERLGHPGADEGIGFAVVVHENHRARVEVEPDQGAVFGLGAPDRVPVQVDLVVVVVRGEAPGGAVLDGVRVGIAVRPARGRFEPGGEALVAVRV